MASRGKSLLLPFALILCFGAPARAAMPVKYTAPPAMASLNARVPGAPAYSAGAGAFHALVSRIFDGADVELAYAPSDSYNMAVQNTMLYKRAGAPDDGIDLVVGIAFDEDNLKYLDYVPVPVYEDFLAIAVDVRSFGAGFVSSSVLDTAVMNVMREARPVAVLKLRLDVADAIGAERFARVEDAFEAVFTLRKFLVAPWSFVEGYISAGASNPRVKSLRLFRDAKRKVAYFVAIGKAAAARVMPSGIALGEFVSARLGELAASGELARIFGAK